MAEYIAEKRLALAGGIVEEGGAFKSDAVPGQHWLPQDREAKAAVKARDAAKAEAVAHSKSEAEKSDSRIAELEAKLAEAEDLAKLRDEEIAALTEDVASGLQEISRQAAEIEALTASIAKFDGDSDGKPGSFKPKSE
ncbi:hypothetical protein V8J38_11150 [Brevundimonas olei]|uniref:Uncharacterized protein n=1 Tax=Brevundimonas olei TaxID=657642 RepID=A0ABZ2IFY6_9CAUL